MKISLLDPGLPSAGGRLPIVQGDETYGVDAAALIAALLPVWNFNIDHVYPDEFDALAGSGPTHDDIAALEAMDASALSTGRIPATRPGRRYYLSRTWKRDPSRLGLIGNGAIYDWKLKTFVDPASQPELLSDPEFDSGTPWLSGSDNSIAAGGSLTYHDGLLDFSPAAGVYNYLSKGQAVAFAAGSVYRVTIVVESGAINTDGPSTRREFSFRFGVGAIAAGSGGSLRTITMPTAGFTAGQTYTFDVTAPSGATHFALNSAMYLKLRSVSLKLLPNNTCLQLTVPPGSAGGQLRGHTYRPWGGFKLTNSGDAATAQFAIASTFDTPVYPTGDLGQHSRVNWYNFEIADGIGIGFDFRNRTYLSVFVGGRVVCSRRCVQTLPGADDSGEKISFIGMGFGGGYIGISNEGGFEIHLSECSIDFSRQWIVANGGVTLRDCHLETNAPTLAVYPLIDVTAGNVQIFAKLQVNGSTTPVLEYPFMVAKNAVLTIETETPYNLQGTSGALCGGEGRFLPRMRGGANKVLSSITKRDDAHNRFGPAGRFAGSRLDLPAYARSVTTPSQQKDRTTLTFKAQGSFTADAAPGSPILANTSISPTSALNQAEVTSSDVLAGTRIVGEQNAGSFTGTASVDSNVVTGVSPAPGSGTTGLSRRYVSSPNFPLGTYILGYNAGAATLTLSNKAISSGAVTLQTSNIVILSHPWSGPGGSAAASTEVDVPYIMSTGGIGGAELSTTQLYNGQQSMRLYKGAGVGSAGLVITIPFEVEPGRGVGAEFYWMVPGGGSGTVDLYFTSRFARLIEGGVVPVSAPGSIAITDQPQTDLDRVAGVPWTRASFSTHRVDASSAHDGYAPDWATHCCIDINLTSAPSNFEMFTAAFCASIF